MRHGPASSRLKEALSSEPGAAAVVGLALPRGSSFGDGENGHDERDEWVTAADAASFRARVGW